MFWDKIQFFAALISLICLIVSYWYSLKEYKTTHTVYSGIKLFTVLISLATLIVWFKEMAKISFIFIIIAMASMIKSRNNGRKQDSGMDMG